MPRENSTPITGPLGSILASLQPEQSIDLMATLYAWASDHDRMDMCQIVDDLVDQMFMVESVE